MLLPAIAAAKAKAKTPKAMVEARIAPQWSCIQPSSNLPKTPKSEERAITFAAKVVPKISEIYGFIWRIGAEQTSPMPKNPSICSQKKACLFDSLGEISISSSLIFFADFFASSLTSRLSPSPKGLSPFNSGDAFIRKKMMGQATTMMAMPTY